ncbi:MAG: hypothetical protein HZB55_16970 [Deltaproteobacteria bacterium]|nr:hypothetical protein [Deltaproteobacteria bacterium]
MVRIADHLIHAESVPDFYKMAMAWLVDNGHMQRVDTLVPFKTSQQRYLIAKTPRHPNGKDFFSPVNHRGYYMEAHKNYRDAVFHLRKLLANISLHVEYVAND